MHTRSVNSSRLTGLRQSSGIVVGCCPAMPVWRPWSPVWPQSSRGVRLQGVPQDTQLLIHHHSLIHQVAAVASCLPGPSKWPHLLVFSLGNDSPLWPRVNCAGVTHFLEHNPSWIERVQLTHPQLSIALIEPTTRCDEAEAWFNDPVDVAVPELVRCARVSCRGTKCLLMTRAG